MEPPKNLTLDQAEEWQSRLAARVNPGGESALPLLRLIQREVFRRFHEGSLSLFSPRETIAPPGGRALASGPSEAYN